MVACHGFKDESNLTKPRFSLSTKRTKKKLTATQRPPKIESVPPTTEVFQLNVLRVHFQAFIWMNSLEENLLEIDR